MRKDLSFLMKLSIVAFSSFVINLQATLPKNANTRPAANQPNQPQGQQDQIQTYDQWEGAKQPQDQSEGQISDRDRRPNMYDYYNDKEVPGARAINNRVDSNYYIQDGNYYYNEGNYNYTPQSGRNISPDSQSGPSQQFQESHKLRNLDKGR